MCLYSFSSLHLIHFIHLIHFLIHLLLLPHITLSKALLSGHLDRRRTFCVQSAVPVIYWGIITWLEPVIYWGWGDDLFISLRIWLMCGSTTFESGRLIKVIIRQRSVSHKSWKYTYSQRVTRVFLKALRFKVRWTITYVW